MEEQGYVDLWGAIEIKYESIEYNIRLDVQLPLTPDHVDDALRGHVQDMCGDGHLRIDSIETGPEDIRMSDKDELLFFGEEYKF